MRNRLTDGVASGSSQDGPEPAVPHDEGGTVTGELAPSRVRVHGIARGLERAVGQRVVQPDARALRHDAAAEQVSEGEGGRHGVARCIGDHEMGGVTVRPAHGPGRNELTRLRGIQAGCLLVPVGRGEQPFEGRRRHLRVPGPTQPAPERMLGRLGEPVQAGRRVVPQSAHVVAAHKAEPDQ